VRIIDSKRSIHTKGSGMHAIHNWHALTNTFLTGQTLHIDGGEPLT